MNKHTHAYTMVLRNGCHRHSLVETTSTPKLQLFLFALSMCASERESTKNKTEHMLPYQKHMYSFLYVVAFRN